MSSSDGLEARRDTPEPNPKQQLFSEITYENLDTAASEASLRGRHRSSPASSSTTSSAQSAAYGGWSRFSVAHGGDAAIRSVAGNSIFTGRLSFKRSLQWVPTASVDRKLRERRLSLWRYGSLEGAVSASFRRAPQPSRNRQLLCFALSFLAAGITLVVLVVCLRLYARNADPLDSAPHVPQMTCDQFEYCSDEYDVVQRTLNRSVSPCEDFHEFACGTWTRSHGGYSAPDEEKVDSVLNTLLTRALAEMAKRPSAPPMANGSTFEFELANDVLFEECMKTDTRERRTLGMARKELAEFGLSGWPYTEPQHHDVTFTNVLVAASRLAMGLGLTALVSVRVFGGPRDRTFEVDDPILLLRKDDLSSYEMKARSLVLHRQLIAESFFYFSHTSKDVYRVQEQIQLVSLILAHASRRVSERSFCTFSHVTAALGELGVLELYIRRLLPEKANITSNATVLLRNPTVASSLDFVFRYLQPEHLLNYLGFRLLVHLSPFIFEIPNNIVRARMYQLTGIDKMVWLKAEVCLRLSEEVLPLLHLYDLYATKPPEYWQNLDNFVNVIKRTVLTQAVVPWKFSSEDKKKLLRILMLMEFKTFLPRWLLNDTQLDAYNRRLLPKRNGDVFQMYSHVWRRRMQAAMSLRPPDKHITDPEWYGSVFDTMPFYSFPENTLYVPMALFNTTLPSTRDAFYMHAVAVTWKLAYALAPIFELSNYWDNVTLTSYASYEACAASRYGPYLTPGIRDSALHLAYADEISVFWSERLIAVFLATSAVNPLIGYDRERFFYLYTAMSKCRSYGVSLQPTATVTSKQRVNIPYLYSAKFRKRWSCKNYFRCK
ncbi:hypothetical protein V5799_030899 [Amblyomma americanum]|uniref:Peptidase M13 N-terminal domain-containing protein n=1 Tax=Amblyomma americanum TaxID=6943 RepID=A0AAQ4EJ82_AMBAM